MIKQILLLTTLFTFAPLLHSQPVEQKQPADQKQLFEKNQTAEQNQPPGQSQVQANDSVDQKGQEQVLPGEPDRPGSVDPVGSSTSIDPTHPSSSDSKLTSRSHSAFTDGLAAYDAQDFASAYQLFWNQAQTSPNDAAAFYNLALSAYQLKKWGTAVAMSRKALAIDPNHSASESLLKKLMAENPSKNENQLNSVPIYETISERLLRKYPLMLFVLITLVSLVWGGWKFLEWLGERKAASGEAQNENETLSFGFLDWKVVALLLIGFVFLLLSGLKTFDISITRATILPDKVEARALPDENAPALFDFNAGTEVEVITAADQWIQVYQPGGYTGWIKKDALFRTAGPKKW